MRPAPQGAEATDTAATAAAFATRVDALAEAAASNAMDTAVATAERPPRVRAAASVPLHTERADAARFTEALEDAAAINATATAVATALSAPAPASVFVDSAGAPDREETADARQHAPPHQRSRGSSSELAAPSADTNVAVVNHDATRPCWPPVRVGRKAAARAPAAPTAPASRRASIGWLRFPL